MKVGRVALISFIILLTIASAVAVTYDDVCLYPTESNSMYCFEGVRSDALEDYVYSTFIVVRNVPIQFNASNLMTFTFYDLHPDHIANAGDLIINYTASVTDNTSYVEYKFGNMMFERPIVVYKDGILFYVQTEPIQLKFVAENVSIDTVGIRFYDGTYYLNKIMSDETLVKGVVSNVWYDDSNDETNFVLGNTMYTVTGFVPLSDGDFVVVKTYDGEIVWMYVNIDENYAIGTEYEAYVASAQVVGFAPPAIELPAIPSIEAIASNVGYALALVVVFLVVLFVAKRMRGGEKI